MNITLSFLELKCKTVINTRDGKNLGHIIDIVFDLKGRIEGIVTPGFKKFFVLKAVDDIFIPWCDVKKIGEDTILVDLCHKPDPHPEPKPGPLPPPRGHDDGFGRLCSLLAKGILNPKECHECKSRHECAHFPQHCDKPDGCKICQHNDKCTDFRA